MCAILGQNLPNPKYIVLYIVFIHMRTCVTQYQARCIAKKKNKSFNNEYATLAAASAS